MAIKNIIFDIGNVILRWSPQDILENCFPAISPSMRSKLLHILFLSNAWRLLNLGINDYIAQLAQQDVSIA